MDDDGLRGYDSLDDDADDRQAGDGTSTQGTPDDDDGADDVYDD